MSPRCQLRQLSSALVAVSALTLVAAAPGSPAEAGSLVSGTSPNACETAGNDPSSQLARAPRPQPLARTSRALGPDAPAVALGLRTDRLSAKQRDRWLSIVRLVFAEDDLGQPLHPMLRRMWDHVATSGHEVFVELPEPNRSACCMAGLFRIESVRPDGHIVAVVRLHLETIDQATVRDTAHYGFRRFHGLEREGRYAEVLGHELGHAVWTLADPARAHHSLALRSRSQELARALPKAKPGARAEIHRRLSELGAQAEAQEVPARAAEARVWQELVASRAARGAQTASAR